MHYSDPEPGSQPLERQAHRFAAALLLPDEPFTKDFTAVGVNWTALMGVKRKWQVSLAAILLRARDLELLTPSAYEAAVRQMSRRGWRQREPGELGPPERPALLRKAAELMSENGIELDEIASQAQIPLVLLKDLVDLVSEERPLVTV
jgi:Zn-dependent peptidase ImmA (M78 family)